MNTKQNYGVLFLSSQKWQVSLQIICVQMPYKSNFKADFILNHIEMYILQTDMYGISRLKPRIE